jgi:hypothetical protein
MPMRNDGRLHFAISGSFKMNQDIKTYKINWQDGDYNSFVGEVVSRRDHDQEVQALKAEIDRLNNKYDFQLLVKSNEALKEQIASMNDSNFKLYNQTEEQFKIIQDQKKEIEVLEAKLVRCLQMCDSYRLKFHLSADYAPEITKRESENDLKELSAITIDSIKRGEG